MLFTSLTLMACSVCFLIASRVTSQRVVPRLCEMGPSILIISQENALHTHPQANSMEVFSQLKSLIPR